MSTSLCNSEEEFLLPGSRSCMLVFEELVIPYHLHEGPHQVVHCGNVEVVSTITRLLKPLVVNGFGEIAGGHFSKVCLRQALQISSPNSFIETEIQQTVMRITRRWREAHEHPLPNNIDHREFTKESKIKYTGPY